MTRILLRLGAAWMILLLASGCVSSSKRVECTGRLEPINAPAPSPARPAEGQR